MPLPAWTSSRPPAVRLLSLRSRSPRRHAFHTRLPVTFTCSNTRILTCRRNRQEDLRIEGHWRVNGTHYARTSEAWLSNMDSKKDEIMPILGQIYGEVGTPSIFAFYFRGLPRMFFTPEAFRVCFRHAGGFRGLCRKGNPCSVRVYCLHCEPCVYL